MKARIIGKKVRTAANTQTGELKTYRTLFVEYLPAVLPEGQEGHETDAINVKFDVSGIKVGGIYDLNIVKNNYQGNRYTSIESYAEVAEK